MKIKAHAKINLSLNIKGQRSDGYHEIESIMVPLALADDLIVEESDHDYLTISDPSLPIDERNTAFKALKLMKETYQLTTCYHVDISKNIPHEAGLGGGSSDAAAVMRAINELAKLNVSIEELAALSVKIGADCPFCMNDRPMLIEGIGEKCTFIDWKEFPYQVLLVKPSTGVSTKAAYQMMDTMSYEHPNIENLKKQLESNDFTALALGNSLEEASMTLNPEIAIIKQELQEAGFEHVVMCGSGSCVFGLTKDINLLNEISQKMGLKYPFVASTVLVL